MMQAYRTEGNYRSAARLSPAELRAAMANREILQATALAFDTQRQLRFEIGGVRAVMPFAQCADGAANGTVRDIAVLTRVGRPTCFVIEALDTDENGQPFYRLSRALAQQQGAILASLVRWYTPAEALIMATSTNAELLALSGKRNPYPGKLGVVEQGAFADLLLVDGNPLDNISLVADPKNFTIIMKDGVIYKNALAK